jgi:hypothetical protein
MEEQQAKNRTEELLEENLRLNKEIYEVCVKLKKYMFAAQIYSIIKFFLIMIPIIVAIIFFLPLFSQISPYLKDIPTLLKISTMDYQSLLK